MGKLIIPNRKWWDYTYCPWHGCVKVSPGSDNCYADSLSAQRGFLIWGKNAARRFFGDAHWRRPAAWNREAEREGRRYGIFCGSMLDILETRRDAIGEEMQRCRVRVYQTIDYTPWLDWRFLTKRAKNYEHLVPRRIL